MDTYVLMEYCITPSVLAIAIHTEISVMNWGYENPAGNHHWRAQSGVSIVLWSHLAVSGEPGVPREELQQAGHGVQVVLALPALARLARRLVVVVVVTGL